MTVTLAEAQTHLADLIAKQLPGEAILITVDDRVIARLTKVPPRRQTRRVAGSAKGTIVFMADDFDAPLEDFKEYM